MNPDQDIRLGYSSDRMQMVQRSMSELKAEIEKSLTVASTPSNTAASFFTELEDFSTVLSEQLADAEDRFQGFEKELSKRLEERSKKMKSLQQERSYLDALGGSEDEESFEMPTTDIRDRLLNDLTRNVKSGQGEAVKKMEQDVYHSTRRVLEFVTNPRFRRREPRIEVNSELIHNANDESIHRLAQEAREDLLQQVELIKKKMETKSNVHAQLLQDLQRLDSFNLSGEIKRKIDQLAELLSDPEQLSTYDPDFQQDISNALNEHRERVGELLQQVKETEEVLQRERNTHDELMSQNSQLNSELARLSLEKSSLLQSLENLTQTLETQKSRAEQIQRLAQEQQARDRNQIDQLQRTLEEQVSISGDFRDQVGNTFVTLEQHLAYEKIKTGQLEEQLAQERARTQAAKQDKKELTDNVTRLTAELESRALDVKLLRHELQNITQTYGDQQSVTEQVRQQAAEQRSADQEQIEALHRMLEEQISASRQYRVQIEATMSQFQQEVSNEADMKIEKLSALLNEERGRADKLQEQLSMTSMKISVLEAQKAAQTASAARVIDEQLREEQLRSSQAEQKLERARNRAKALQASLEEQQALYLRVNDDAQKASLEVKNQQELLNDIHEFLKLFQQLNAHQQQFLLSENKIFDHLFKALEALPRTRELLRGARLKLQEQFRRGDEAEAKGRSLENIIREQRQHFDATLDEAQATIQQAERRLNDAEEKSLELEEKAKIQGSELESLRDQVLVLQGEKDEADAKRIQTEQQLAEQQSSLSGIVANFSEEKARTQEVFQAKLKRAEDLLHRLNAALQMKTEEVEALKSQLQDVSKESERKRTVLDKKVLEKSKEIGTLKSEMESLKREMDSVKIQMESLNTGLNQSKTELREVRSAFIGEKEERRMAEERTVLLAHRLEQAEMELESHFNCTIRSKLLSLTELGRDLKLSTEDFEKLLSATLPIDILRDLANNMLSKRLVLGFGREPYQILEEIINDSSLSQRFRNTTLSFREGLNILRQLEVTLKALAKIRKPIGGAFDLQKYDINDRALAYLEDHLSEQDFRDILKKASNAGHFDNPFHMDRSLKSRGDFTAFLPRVILSEVENHMGSLLNETRIKVK